jgi:hypothetical protein
MGAGRRKREFLAKNSTCLFCGGQERATTIDHIPSRSFFLRRQWPESFEFPACQPCNSITANSEQLAAFICRIRPDAGWPAELVQELSALMRGIYNNYRGLIAGLRPSARQVRRWLRESGQVLPEGATTDDAPFFSLQDERIEEAMRLFAFKLFCALHFKHTGKILPRTGGVAFRWWSNIQVIRGEVPRNVTELLNQFGGELCRAKTSLNDQFWYQFGLTETQEMGGYLAVFNQCTALFGAVSTDVARLGLRDGQSALRPFNWSATRS